METKVFVTKQQLFMLEIISYLSVSDDITFYIIDLFYNPEYFWRITRHTRKVLNNLLKKELVKIIWKPYNNKPWPYYFITALGEKVLKFNRSKLKCETI